MAIITKLRDKYSWLLITIVGLALVIFILQSLFDFMNSGRGAEGDYGIGLVDGEKVNIDIYNKLSERVQSQDRAQKQQEQKEFTDEDTEAANDKAFNFMVDSTLTKVEYDALGIDVSEREFNAYLMATEGFGVLQDLNQFFVDKATGAISEQSMKTGRVELQKTLTKLKTAKKPEEKAQWDGTKKYFMDRRKNEKYFSLISQGIYVTKVEAREEYLAKKETKSISFVARRYSEINDAEIKISDSELEAYYDEHKGDKKYWNRSNNREVRVFDVSIKPSKADTLAFNKTMAKLRMDFMNSKNDSMLVMNESEMRAYLPGARGITVPEGHPKANQYMTYPMDYDTIIKLTPYWSIGRSLPRWREFPFIKINGLLPCKN